MSTRRARARATRRRLYASSSGTSIACGPRLSDRVVHNHCVDPGVARIALVSGHWSAWQAARVEVNQDVEAKARADEDIADDVVESVIEKTDIDRA